MQSTQQTMARRDHHPRASIISLTLLSLGILFITSLQAQGM
jgi:hypothetical protein